MSKTLPNIANPHIRIYREIGQQVLASIEDGRTDTHTDRRTNFIYIDCICNGTCNNSDFLMSVCYVKYVIAFEFGVKVMYGIGFD